MCLLLDRDDTDTSSDDGSYILEDFCILYIDGNDIIATACRQDFYLVFDLINF